MDTKEWKDLKNLISSLLVSSPLQLTIRTLNNDFRNEVGYSIPYEKFGFKTLDQCLDNMNDVLERNGGYVSVRVSSKAAHIDKLVSRQAIPSSRRRSNISTNRKRPERRHTTLNYENYKPLPRNTNTCTSIPPLFPSNGLLVEPPKHFFQNMNTYQLLNANTSQHNPKTPQPSRKSLSSNFVHSTPLVPHKVQQIPLENYSSVQSSSKILSCQPKEVQSLLHEKSSTKLSQGGSNDINIKAAKSEPQLPLISDTNANTQREIDKHKLKNNYKERLVVNTRVPLEVQKNLIQLISKFDNGIWCGKLPETYQRLYKTELDFAKYGYKNLILMCMELEKIFYCYRPHTADFILYDRIKQLPDDFEPHFMQTTDSNIKPTEIETVINTVPKPDYPLNVLHPFNVIPKQFTSFDIKKDDFIEVCVAEIYTPDQFFVILTKFSMELDNLMDSLQTFYMKRASEFKIPQQILTENLFCVTLYGNEYHRAKIVEISPQKTCIKVFCFDYGSIDIVKPSDLYYLHKRFAGLPQQAIEAQLAGIKPVRTQDKWSEKESLELLELTRDKDLYAHVLNVDRVHQRISIFLADTCNETDIYINDMLVSKGYAAFTHQQPACEPKEVTTEDKEKKHSRKTLLKSLLQLHAKRN